MEKLEDGRKMSKDRRSGSKKKRKLSSLKKEWVAESFLNPLRWRRKI